MTPLLVVILLALPFAAREIVPLPAFREPLATILPVLVKLMLLLAPDTVTLEVLIAPVLVEVSVKLLRGVVAPTALPLRLNVPVPFWIVRLLVPLALLSIAPPNEILPLPVVVFKTTLAPMVTGLLYV